MIARKPEEPLHTPEELQFLSNLAHWIEGGIVGLVAIIALIQAFGVLDTGLARFLWPSLILLAGLFLPPYILLHHGLDRVGLVWRYTINDPQQRQHFLIALLLLASGISEILWRAVFQQSIALKLVWPATLIIVGLLFTIHTQHGTEEAVARAVVIHRYLAIVLILAGLFKAADVLFAQQFAGFAFIWPTFLLIAAALLIGYREPKGAFMGMPLDHR